MFSYARVCVETEVNFIIGTSSYVGDNMLVQLGGFES